MQRKANAVSLAVLGHFATVCCFSVALSSNGASTTVTTWDALRATVPLNGRGDERARADVFQAMLRLGPERTDVNMASIISFPTTVMILSTDWEDIWPQIADVDLIQNRHFSETDFRTMIL